MPAQKRPRDPAEDDPQQDADNQDLQPDDVNELERSPSPSSDEEETADLVDVNLPEIRKEVQCPICLGIIRKTRTVMECLHRFCRECIDKSMRLGNNECPACRTHCASRRSLRDDPNFDTLISILYPDIDKYEEEELAFHEEEKARNKQIQASIAETVRRQNEALGKKKQTAKAATALVSGRRPKRTKNDRAMEQQASDDSEDGNSNEGAKESSADEPDIRSRRPRRWAGSRYSQPSSAGFNQDGGDDNDVEVAKEPMLASIVLGAGSDRLAWGQSGLRSHNRSGGNGKNTRNSRVHKLVDHFGHMGEINNEHDLELLLIPLDEQSVPSLQRPYLSCKPNQTVGDLCQYVAYQTRMQAREIELLVVKEPALKYDSLSNVPIFNSGVTLPWTDDMELLEFEETMGRLKDVSNSCATHMLLAYRKKLKSEQEAE
uniref:RING1a n=1 Tax=Kalanchoe serrata TaxID=2498011 RepID=A0A3S9KRY8_9MAGN|nr:RING1a [Kalanchoe serrata]